MEVYDKSQTVDPEVRAYISSLVSAVGGQSTLDERYEIGDSAPAVLKDILRWLRLYDDKLDRYDVKRCLADSNLVKGDLLEILALWPEDQQENAWKAKLALECLTLIAALTYPMEVKEETTKVNHVRHMPVLQLAQVGYKRAILHFEGASILRTMVRAGLPAMALERRDRNRRQEGVIRLMLHCFKNLAMITQPQHLPSQGDENEVSRSATINAFHEQDVFSLLLTVGSGVGDEFRDHDVVILETLFHLLKGLDARKLFMEDNQIKHAEVDELQTLMRKEKAMVNSYKKRAPTRHNRFGTMVWVKTGDNRVSTVTGQNTITNASNTLQQMDASKKYNRPKFKGKQGEELNESETFGGRIVLTESARSHLRSFVEDFLDSSFNPLFSSLRKGIESESDRFKSSNHRQFWYLISWFLEAEAARREYKKAQEPSNGTVEDNTFAHIAAVLDQETFVLLNRHMQRAYDEKVWQELRAILTCLTQILLTVQNMSESKDEEDQEIAENILNRIFYEETTHDRIVQVCRTYSNQGLGYLDAVTECVHVFVRMLENYSKQNADLQIRSKRRARRKKKAETQPDSANEDGGPGDDEEAEGHAADDEREAHMTVSERKFDFARFSAKFLSQGCVNTFISLTQFYADLTSAQLKRCHRFFYRLAFKQELAVLLFRVDILLLFQQMIKGPGGLDHGIEGWKEWETLVQQVFRRCFKWIERQEKSGEDGGKGWKEAAVVEMLFSKIPNTLFYLQNGYERVIERRAPRPPAELEVKPSVKEMEKRIGVAVSVMLELGKGDAVEWVKRELGRAGEERQAWQDEKEARMEVDRPAEDGTDAVVADTSSAPTIFLTPDNDERKEALFKDKYLRLLLTTMGMERLGASDDVDASWIVPSDITAATLKESLAHIRSAEHEPPTFDDGKNAQDLIRPKSTAYATRAGGGAAFSDDDSNASQSDADVDAALYGPNLRHPVPEGAERPKKRRRLTKRNQGESLTEEQAEAKAEARRKWEKENTKKEKSKLFITSSDEDTDEERDREFFRLEEERRGRVRRVIAEVVGKVEGGEGGKKGKGKGEKAAKKKQKKRKDIASDESDNEDTGLDDSDVNSDASAASDTAGRPPKRMRTNPFSDDESSAAASHRDTEDKEMENEETPAASPPTLGKAAETLPLVEVSGNVASGKPQPISVDEEEDDDDAPVVKPGTQRRNVRAAFIIEDDEDE
ncbi:Topoisomerase 1-associated factor 1 [Extremus antarcticus]|uniref:Topoisomerase 1-associated factor 1 n=1 Tax=Extremus antarcticus TaxID=702011 RepID=A0AAJ0D8T7_9PEZI|nr:Topoisomerase 1-associated factor 1 [Extremus antarcticus]